ncbi:asparagine synthase (glutamine-hydrolyzing), partial [Rhodobacteraceae bacterium (ex Bugula neritina AB1)]
MCGIAGIYGQGRLSAEQIKSALKSMTDRMILRGPDGDGHWQADQIGFGHRRLAVIDLSEAGDQPMHSHDGRWSMVYNGELYNTEALRSQIDQQRGPLAWRGHADSEVMLEAIALFGPEEALRRADGMFALAAFDHKEQSLTLARDAFGEKPLYYGLVNGALGFASQPGAFRDLPGFDASFDQTALTQYFKLSYIPAPRSIYRGVHKLPPAHFMTLALEDLDKGLPDPQPFWSPRRAALAARGRFEGSYEDALAQLETLMQQSVASRMVSDVPLGCLLSGGIDSSAVAALMARTSGRPRSFCIGMAQDGFNEADHARDVAAHLGCDHTELMLTPGDLTEVVPRLPKIYDEPFSDSSQIPTFLVSQLARQSVTVALSGDGGDEVLGGYNRYIFGPQVWARTGRLPCFARAPIAAILRNLPVNAVATLAGIRGADLRSGRGAEKLQKLADLIPATSEAALYDRLITTAHNSNTLLLNPSLEDCFDTELFN